MKKRLTMRVILTGGAGFLGSHHADLLIANGHQVLALDNFLSGSANNITHLQNHPNFEFRLIDCTLPFDVEGPVDYVAHFASAASPVDFVRIPFDVLRAGSYATENCLQLAERKGAKFVLASTSEVYGDPLISPQREDYWGNVNPIGPRSVYDEAKRFAEATTMAYHRYRGVDTRIIRFFNTYGPRMRLQDGRVVPNFVSQALRGEPLTIYGDGSQTRSFGFCKDVLDCVYRLMLSDVHEPVNIGTEEEITIRQFADAVIRATGSQSKIVHLPAAVDDPQQRRPDISRARQLLEWEPTTDLETGLSLTVEYFRQAITAGN